MKNNDTLMKDIVALCKRRGIIYPSSEIYGGFANTWDYGPYGVLLKNNVKAAWWETMVKHRSDIVGLDSAILMNPKVWEASGHITEFTDPMIDCKQCKRRFKGDDITSDKCPECKGELTPARQFNLMFQTNVGPVAGENVAYLRPETAQGIFVNFKNVLDSTRVKLPFGIAQIGKAFRNEITPGNFTFRTLEFEQAELEYFVDPKDADETFKYWVKEREKWYHTLGINSAKLRIKAHDKSDLAHYAKAVSDVEYEFPFGWSELEGVANRGDYDLTQHAKVSGQTIEYTDDDGKKMVPYVIEPSGGIDRATLAFLVDAYREDEVKGEQRVSLALHPKLAPIKAAILPLVKKEPVVEIAKKIYEELRQEFFVEYDESGTVGKRYRRQDEIGTPYCFTIDFETVDDNAVTVRDRDSMEQERISISGLREFLANKLR
ncbi:MAG: glycine--tRNA ligase [Patescibacteria group bacterium]|jgi:glycyl-tRNA synthetase